MNTVGNITKYDGVMIHNPFCKRSFDTFQQKKMDSFRGNEIQEVRTIRPTCTSYCGCRRVVWL